MIQKSLLIFCVFSISLLQKFVFINFCFLNRKFVTRNLFSLFFLFSIACLLLLFFFLQEISFHYFPLFLDSIIPSEICSFVNDSFTVSCNEQANWRKDTLLDMYIKMNVINVKSLKYILYNAKIIQKHFTKVKTLKLIIFY